MDLHSPSLRYKSAASVPEQRSSRELNGNRMQETTEKAGNNGSPYEGLGLVRQDQPRDIKRMSFGVYGTLRGAGALPGVFDPSFPAVSVVSVRSVKDACRQRG